MSWSWDPERTIDLDGEDEEKGEEALQRDGASCEDGECISISDDDDNEESHGATAMDVDSAATDAETTAAAESDTHFVDLTQDDDDTDEECGEYFPKTDCPRSPAVAHTTALHSSLACWLEVDLWSPRKFSVVPQHELWGALIRQGFREDSAKLRVLDELYQDLSAAQSALLHKKEEALTLAQDLESKRKEVVSKILHDAQREAAAAADEDAEFAILDARQRRINGPDGHQEESLKRARDAQTVRAAEVNARLSCVASMGALVELWRVRIKPSAVDHEREQGTQPLGSLEGSVASEMEAYAFAFETQWAFAPRNTHKFLLEETIAFWRSARFWLRAGVRELVAKQLAGINVPAVKAALGDLACDLYWSQGLASEASG